MGTCQAYLAYFFEHMDIFLVEHIFVNEEGDDAVAEAVPHPGGDGFGYESAQHEGACLEAREAAVEADLRDGLEEVHFAVGSEEVEDARLVEVGAHAAFEHLLDVFVGVAVVPVVDDAFGYVGSVLQFAADEARQFVEVVDDGGLLGGDDVLIGVVGAFHFVEVLHFFGGELDGCAAKEFGEACRPEVGDAFEDALVVAGDGDFVEFVQFQSFAVD